MVWSGSSEPFSCRALPSLLVHLGLPLPVSPSATTANVPLRTASPLAWAQSGGQWGGVPPVTVPLGTQVSTLKSEDMKTRQDSVTKLLTDVQLMKGRQESMDSRLLAMKQ